MANIARTVEIIFAGSDHISQTITGINQGLEAMKKVVDSVLDPMARLADIILELDKKAVSLATTIGTDVVGGAIELESTMVDLQRLLGEEIEVFDELIDGCLELSQVFGMSFEGAIKSVTEFKRASFDAKESLMLVQEAMTLVNVGFVDMATSTEALVKILKGFKADADEANKIVDILSATSNAYATNVEKLAIGMAELAPIAKKVGFSMEETAGLVTAVVEVFQSGEEAATALKTGFTRLATGGARVEKAFKALTMKGTDHNNMLKSGKVILQEIAANIRGMTEAQQVQISAWAVGNRQAQKMVDIFTNYNYTLEIARNAVEDNMYAEKQLAIVLATVKVAIRRVNENWVTLKKFLGIEFLPIVADVVAGLNKIEVALIKSVREGTVKDISERLREYSKQIMEYLTKIALAIPEALAGIDYSELFTSWDKLAEGLGEVFDEVDVTTAEGLAKAIQKIVDALTVLSETTRGILDPWLEWGETVMATMEILGQADSDTAYHFGRLLGHAKMIQEMGVIWWYVFKKMGEDIEGTQDKLATFMDYMKMTKGIFQTVWNASSLSVTMACFSMMKVLDTFTFQTLPAVHKATEELGELMDEQFKLMVDGAKDWYNYHENESSSYRGRLREEREGIRKYGKEFKVVTEEGKELVGAIRDIGLEVRKLPEEATIEIKHKPHVAVLQKELEKYKVTLKQIEDTDHYIIIKAEFEEQSLYDIQDKADEELARKEHNLKIIASYYHPQVQGIIDEIDAMIPEEYDIPIIISKVQEAIGELDKVEKKIEKVPKTVESQLLLKRVEDVKEELREYIRRLKETPSTVETEIILSGITAALRGVEELDAAAEALPTEKDIRIKVQADLAAIKDTEEALKDLPDEKVIELKLKNFELVTERIEVLGDQAQKAYEVEAKLDTSQMEAASNVMIAKIEADADKAIAVIESLGDSISAVSDNIGEMFNALAGMYDRIIDLGEQQIEILEETEQTFEELKDEIIDTISALDDYLDKMQEITDAIEEQEDSVNDLERELAQYERALGRIEQGISTEQIEADLTRIRNEIKEVEKELDYLYSLPYSPENEAKIRKLERELEYLKREEEILSKTLEDSAKAREEFERKILDLKKEIWEKQKEINDLAGDLPEVIGDASKEWDEWMGKIEDAKERLRELYDMGLISKAEYDAAMKYLDELEQKVQGFLDELEAMGVEDIADLQEKIAQEQIEAINKIKEELVKHTEILSKYLEEQSEMQSNLIQKQMELVDAQIEQIEARTDMLKKGDSVIKIQADGLEPELEAFMWKILEALQVRANAEFSEFLIGLRGLNLTTTTGSL